MTEMIQTLTGVTGINVMLLASWFVIAACLYRHQAPWHLYRRRAWLSQYTQDGGRLRRLLWKQSFAMLFLSLQSMVAAVLLIVFASGLAPAEWYVLLAGFPVFVLMVVMPPKTLVREISPALLGLARLRLAVIFTAVITALALILLSLLWLEIPDYRGSQIRALLSAEYESGSQFGGSLFGTLFGLNAAMEAALWYAMQSAATIATELPGAVKVLAWSGFLLVKMATAVLFWAAVAGMLAFFWGLGGRFKNAPPRLPGNGRLAFVTVVLLTLMTGALLHSPEWLTLMGERKLMPFAGLESGCVSPQERAQLRSESSINLESQRQASLERIDARVNDQLATIYRSAERGVDEFLDWHYSIRGQYSQLGVWAASRIGGESYEGYIQSRMSSFVSEPMQNRLAALEQDLQSAFEFEVASLGRQHASYLDALLDEDCLQLGASMPALPVQLARTTAGLGSIAGVSSYALTRFGVRYAAQRGGQVAATRSASRFASRVATTGVSSGSSVLCGPLVIVCAPVLAAGAWAGADWLINRADEAMHREAMKQEIMTALDAERLMVAEQLVSVYQRAMQDIADEVDHWQQQRYRILRDGV